MFEESPRPIPQYQALKHGTSVETFLKEHRPHNPEIAVVGFHTGKVFYFGHIDGIDPSTFDMHVAMAHPEEKRYVYGEDRQPDGGDIIYMIVVDDDAGKLPAS